MELKLAAVVTKQESEISPCNHHRPGLKETSKDLKPDPYFACLLKPSVTRGQKTLSCMAFTYVHAPYPVRLKKPKTCKKGYLEYIL